MKKITLSIPLLLMIALNSIIAGDISFKPGEIKLKLKERSAVEYFDLSKKKENNISVKSTKLSFTESTFKSAYNPRKIKQYKVNPVKLTILGVAGAGVFTGLHIFYANTWWKDQRDYFKFATDGYYARNIDKASHIFTANAITVGSAVAYEWAGIAPGKALLYGALTSFAYETYIEINDGFAPNWGFDWGDVGANVFGAVYPFLQEEFKPLKHVNFKWSFKPRWIKAKTSSAEDDLLDDYTNMTFWLSVNPMIIFPKSVTKAKFYPNFLALAVGMSIKDASHVTGSGKAQVEWYLSFDWDVSQLPGKSDFMQKLKRILNFYHFPAPAVKISPEGVWYGLYF
jgi:hypothetical protein